MTKYQDFMVVPTSDIRMPAACDFFDVKKWSARFTGNCNLWLEMFCQSQSFTQFLEVRLAPSESPALETVFFNESIDAKLNRASKTKFFTKQTTPLLSTGLLPPGGYSGHLVPPSVRTVYNASMIAARPVRAQQQVALLLVLGSGLSQTDADEVTAFKERLKQEFAANLVWSRVDVAAALSLHVCPWRSIGSEAHGHFQVHGMENMPVRKALLDLTMYANVEYKRECEKALEESLAEIAHACGGHVPLCVVSHGFGSVIAYDYFLQQQQSAGGSSTPLQRGQTLAYFCTLGSPMPLLANGQRTLSRHAERRVPAPYMLERWPQLRGGWSNFHHKADTVGFPLQVTHTAVNYETEVNSRKKQDAKERVIQNAYLNDLPEFVRPVAQALSWVWQDTNRPAKPQLISS